MMNMRLGGEERFGDMTLAIRRATAIFAAAVLIAGCSQPQQPRAEEFDIVTQRPMVSFTFDDAFAQDMSVVKPLIDANGIKAGFAIPSGYVGSSPSELTWDQVKQLADDGNEIIAHTITHPHLPSLTSDQQQREIDNRAVYESHGIRVKGFAYPFGEHDAQLRSRVAKYYEYGLGILSDASSSEAPLRAYAIRRVAITDSTPLADLLGKVEAAIKNAALLIFIVHSGDSSFTVGGGGPQLVSDVITYLRVHGVPIVTPGRAVDMLTRAGP